MRQDATEGCCWHHAAASQLKGGCHTVVLSWLTLVLTCVAAQPRTIGYSRGPSADPSVSPKGPSDLPRASKGHLVTPARSSLRGITVPLIKREAPLKTKGPVV